jgi:hypothetical protein
VPPLLVALNVTLAVPAAVGVPEIKPETVFTVRPAGNPVAPKLVGELVAAIWYEKTVPTVPLAVPPLLITGAASATVTVKVRDALPVPPLLVALKVTLDVPTAPVGVPEIKPEAVFTVRPVGNPDAPKLVGEFVAVIWYEKALPFVALAVPLLVITGAPGRAALTVSIRDVLPVPPLFVAFNVTLADPAAVGVPEINPETLFTVRPAGNPVAPKLVGELVAVIW